MRDHIIGEDYELWDIVSDGLLATTKKNAKGVDMPKTRVDCTAEDLNKWEKNAKAKKWLVCGLGLDEYNRIQSCTTTKEIWDTLQVTHEGTLLESKNIVTLKLDELIGNLTAYELRRQTIKMDAPKKERSLALRIAEGGVCDLKAKRKNLESSASESDSKNTKLKNQVLELDTSILELRYENLKLKLGTGKKKVDHTHITLEENLGKMKDELYKKDEQIRVLKEDLGKVKHELDRACKWNKSSDALSWLPEHHSSNKSGFGYGTPTPKWDTKSKYITLLENKICTHCGKTGHYKSECNAKEKASQNNKTFVQEKNRLSGWAKRNLIHPFAYRKGPKLVWVPKTNP
ncbi:uncharacterized protein [Nicotiana sylvestris]|uniref:uncharacterized protein n=1 Tax=Nicotiana sylvestris TaxID=4096 RepID=UPI00388CCD28